MREPLVMLLYVVAEGLQRPIRVRDVIDGYVLMRAAGDCSVGAWRQLVSRNDLWPEWRRLQARLLHFGLLEPSFGGWPGDGRRSAATSAARVVRAARKYLPLHTGVVAYTQLRYEASSARRLDRYLAANVHRFATAHATLARGLPLFGVPISDTEVAEPALERHDPILVLRSPAGTFGLVPGAFFDEDWLAFVEQPAPAA